MLIRRESTGDVDGVGAVHAAAFQAGEGVPAEVRLVEQLRAGSAWLDRLSLVAPDDTGRIIGHVVCSRADVEGVAVLALGPLGVVPDHQGRGVGTALMHAVIGAADALDEPLIGLLGRVDYYRRFGFVPASAQGIEAPEPAWGAHFQVRTLDAYRADVRGTFRYPAPFDGL